MKKVISIFLSFCMIFCLTLTGCATKVTQSPETGTTIVLKIENPTMTVNGTDMPIDSPTAYLNNTEQTLDSMPTIINDRTMLPIRFIAESFKFSVIKCNDNEQTVTITNTNEPETEPSQQPAENTELTKNSLVVYFSATGNTKALAERIAAASDSDIFEIVPEEPYTSDDLNYNSDCRANKEQNDASARPAISNEVKNIESYNTVFIGYPIWWGTMPKIINTFLDTYDLSGKTILPFCTSGGSGISSSVSAIKNACPNADVKDGFRGTSSTNTDDIKNWLNSVGL